jgi:hypothetical protein
VVEAAAALVALVCFDMLYYLYTLSF